MLLAKDCKKVDCNIAEVIDDYHGLIKVVADTRNEFEIYEKKALKISEFQEYKTTVSRKRKRKLHADESRDGDVQLSGRDHFRVNTFNVILDNLNSELRKRCAAYEKIQEKFSVITEFGNLDNREIRKRAESLTNLYSSDLEPSLDDEFVHFHAYCTEKMIEQNSPSDLLKLLHANDLYTEFPNVEIAYRIFMTLAVTNCSAERSFSCLKRVKNFLRSTMTANRLNSLAILCIESDVPQRLDCEDLIDQFAIQKVRRVCL
ncbi:repressor of the inhibitor of the protein kinase [Danaus plexippus plexippus]|uniref:Repressor of the inhibitor of the protein kinase n=1 Tax=Danaus plexippus plexippus TaxID=278856 RepID=A0A212FA93_DANPL|nr:repressor of the inhibitor of the protein kinase [Danaus plexippus plexippus]